MFKNDTLEQKNGDGSTNYQAESIAIHEGLRYNEVKEIALDVFKANSLELSNNAMDKIMRRAEEFMDNFLVQLEQRNPKAINTLEEPSMQYAIFSAQQEYAKTGDKELSDLLIDILVDRASLSERNLKQIVLTESLTIATKLTTDQIDALTLVFILRYSSNNKVLSINSLKEYLSTNIEPFISSSSKEVSLYQHLEYTGCASVSSFSWKIESAFSTNYSGLFFKGFTIEQLSQDTVDFCKTHSILISCIHNQSKFQINVINKEALEQKLIKINANNTITTELKTLLNQHQMSEVEIKELLLKQGGFMETLFDVFDNSSMKHLTLTSVGIAIATANLRRKVGINVDLGAWIK